jgi:hypothetical protein
MDTFDRDEFVHACHVMHSLTLEPAVAAAWSEESSCAGMSVGGLTHHVLGQVRNSTLLLSQPPRDDPPIALLDHYARAAWVESSADDEANVSIRDGDNAAASDGPAAVLGVIPALLEQLPALLAAARTPDTVHIPWQGWSLSTDDFLVTRAMELVVHSDDLASSVGLPTPEFPPTVVAHTVDLLAGVAMRRHGQAAVVRALSRPQRAPATVSAF